MGDAVLYLHPRAAGSEGVCGPGWVENHGPRLVDADTIREWLTAAGVRVSMRPVLDLNGTREVAGYAIPDRIREQVVLTYRTCAFPHCTRPARGCDLDHAVAYDHDAPTRGGPTSTSNLIPLCRRHHRLKTFTAWRPTIEGAGVVHWRGPAGYEYRRDPAGTESLSPAVAGPRYTRA